MTSLPTALLRSRPMASPPDRFASSRMTEGGLHQDGGAWGRKEERGFLNKSFNFHTSKVKVVFCHIIDLVDLFL